MITHIVLFKLINRSDIAKAKEVLLSMNGKIPQLRHLEVGTDILQSKRSYDIALIAKFDSMEDMQAYQTHPVHVAVSDYITTIRELSVSVDYES